MLYIFCITVALLILFTACTDKAASVNVLRFSQPTYSVNEGDGLLQPTLVLDGSLSTSFAMRVRSISITATGKYIIMIINM